MSRASLIIVACLGACYSPGYKDCEITCASGSCPSGLTCASGVCREPGMTGACNVTPGDGGADAPHDTMPDAPRGVWTIVGKVQLQGPTGSGFDDPTLTGNMLEMFVNANGDIFRTQRPTQTSLWGQLVNEPSLNTSNREDTPQVTADGTMMYFASDRPGGSGAFDLYVAERPVGQPMWINVSFDLRLSSNRDDTGAGISDDKMTMVMDSDRNSAGDLFLANRPGVGDLWMPPMPMGSLNTVENIEESPMLSPDKLTIYFQVTEPSTQLGDLWMATRPDLSQPFGPPVPISELNTPNFSEEDPWVSPDGQRMFFASNRDGLLSIWEARR